MQVTAAKILKKSDKIHDDFPNVHLFFKTPTSLDEACEITLDEAIATVHGPADDLVRLHLILNDEMVE